jgi:hypothetical protein
VLDPREHVAGDAAQLQAAVRTALEEPAAVLGEWQAELVQQGDSRALYRLAGTARVGTAVHPWQMVLKQLGPAAGPRDPAGIFYPRRELLLYQSGLLDGMPAGLRAPRCWGCDELEDGAAWLWLEHVREEGEPAWPLARWALAARHLGWLNGAGLPRPLPPAPWLGGCRLRSWLERHGPLVERIAAAPRNPAVRRLWPPPVVDAIQRLWAERDAFCAALERLPQTFCHGDAIRRNLFARRGSDGSEETVAIDWEFAGLMAPGEEAGQMVSVAAAFFDVTPADLPALDEAVFAGYLAGLRDAGWRGDERPVRFAYAAHMALRNAFNAVGATVPDEAARASAQHRFGHTWEELAEARAAVRPFLLERAREARELMRRL